MADKYIEGIKQNMLLVIPKRFLANGKIKLNVPENKDIMYETICNHACLNAKSKNVRQAFEELWA